MSKNPFEELAERYDAWFDRPRGSKIFLTELECLRALSQGLPRPWLEVGVGTGRFAEALGVDEGIDPSRAVLKFAAARGIRTRPGRAEALPYPPGSFGAVFLIITLCFVKDARKALCECARVLKAEGRLVVGIVPGDSPWGEVYAREGQRGHRFYSAARFFTFNEVVEIATEAGLELEDAMCCLRCPPRTAPPETDRPQRDILEDAGFVAGRFRLARKNPRFGKAQSLTDYRTH